MIREVGDIVTVDLDVITGGCAMFPNVDYEKLITGKIVAILAKGVYLFRNSWNEQRVTENELS